MADPDEEPRTKKRRQAQPRIKPTLVTITKSMFQAADKQPWIFSTDDLDRLNDIVIIYDFNPPPGWGKFPEIIELLQHLYVHNSNNPRYTDKLDSMLAVLQRVCVRPSQVYQEDEEHHEDLKRQVHEYIRAHDDSEQKLMETEQTLRSLQQEHTDIVQLRKKEADDRKAQEQARDPELRVDKKLRGTTEKTPFAIKFLMLGVQAALQARQRDDLAGYFGKILDESIPADERQIIRNTTLYELAARLTETPSNMLPKHYTVRCDCGKDTIL
ncbi:hypothetical protein LX36DRAFT_704633 [Colletotrichum falcatum]|nr:hypothetical protein LX36DRAFT_704633 [Colletotrichum falcatum]